MRIWLVLLCALVVAEPLLGAKGDVSVSYAYIYVNITNEAPVITSLELGRSAIYEDTDIECIGTATDREGEAVGYHYNWFRNDVELGFHGRVLSEGYFDSDDVVMCELVPYDRYANGSSARASAIVLAAPIQARVVKTALAAAGVQRNTAEIASVTEKGLAATTGFVVKEVGGSSAASVGLLMVAVGFLVVINMNLLLRVLRKRRNIA